MKKLLLLVMALTMFVAVAPTSSATDICSDTPLSSADFNAEITSAVYLRTISCMQESTVTATLSAGEVVKVIGLTEGWHKIQRADGSTGWIWETFITSTNKPFNLSTEPEPTLYVEPEPIVEYVAMRDISGHKYEDGIWYVYNNDIVQGYPDGSYLPDQTINRAELLKIIVESAYTNEFEAFEGQGCFTDVPAGEWYAKYVCFAEDEGLVEGYEDGSFKPAQQINFVEALKIAMVGFGNTYTVGDPWYKPTVEAASVNNLIPLDIYGFNQAFKRGQMADMITRMLKNEDSTINDYLGDKQDLIVTYESIDAGLQLEDFLGTEQCVYKANIYENGDPVVMTTANCECVDGEITNCLEVELITEEPAQCELNGTFWDDGETAETAECTTCTCSDGEWINCTGLCLE